VIPSQPYVTWARLALPAGTDPQAVGAAVTIELCGSIDHQPLPCRWPHNNDYEEDDAAVFRTLFAAPPDEEQAVRARIEQALRGNASWTVLEVGAREVLPGDEEALAGRLCAVPRREAG
jgi:hypothetical protein